MAEVPSYGGFRAAPQGPSGAFLTVPDATGFDQPLKDLSRASDAAFAAGHQIADVVLKAQHDANQVHVMDATNQGREAALTLTYDPQQGYTNVKGKDVLPTGGTPLAVDYAGRYKETLRSIAGGLTNDEQRQLFAQQSAQLMSSFEAGAFEHEQREWQTYSQSVFDGATKISTESIKKNYSNPAMIDTEVENIRASVAASGKHLGLSGNDITYAQNAKVSGAVTGAIAQALEARDTTTANALYQRYKSHLVADDDLRVKGTLQQETAAGAIMQAADIADGIAAAPSTTTGGGKAILPVAGARITSRFGDAREGGKTHEGADLAVPVGTPVKAPMAGKVIRVWEDAENGKAVRIQFSDGSVGGFAHLSEQGVQNGDPVTQGQVFAKSGNTGHSTGPHLHYRLEKGGQPIDPLAAGGGGPAVAARAATLDDMWATARAALVQQMPDPRPEDIRALRAEVDARWNLHQKSKADNEDQALAGVYRELAGNGGSYLALSPSQRAAIPADKLPKVMAFASAARTAFDHETGAQGMATYAQLVSDPQKLAAMGDADFLHLQTQFSKADFGQLARERGNLRLTLAKGVAAAAKDAATLNREGANRAVNERLLSLGLSANPKPDDNDAPRVAAIRMTVDRALLSAQAGLGRRLTDAETAQTVDRLFTANATGSGWFSAYQAPAFSIGKGSIPSVDREAIRQSFAARGNPNPTDADVLAAWYAKNTTGQQK